MKNILKTTIFALLLISLGSCEEDTPPVATANGFTLTSVVPNGPYVLSPIDGDNDVAAFSWTAADNGVATIASDYIVEIAEAGTNFADPIATSASSPETTFIWKEGSLNKILLDNGYIPDVAVDFDIRIKSTLGLGSFPFVQYSNVITTKITPFAQPSFAFARNGENPENAAKLISSNLFTTDCEGYAWLEPGDYKFYTAVQNKYQTSNPYYGSNGAGVLELNGADINIATAGFYYMKANVGLNTYSVSLSEWGVYGLATPFPSAINKKMTYNNSTKKWSITLTLAGGKAFRFRNGNSTSILGLYDEAKVGPDYAGTEMSYNGRDIFLPGTTPASYTVTLDLNTPRAYTFTFVKQ